MMEDVIINKVALSGLITIDLEEYYHHGERVIYDLKENLFQGLILKEKDFRLFLKSHDWTSYSGKNVAVVCTADAIVPTWAYMLLVVHLEPYANVVVFGDMEALETALFYQAFERVNWKEYEQAKVVIKGCSKYAVPMSAYMEVTRRLRPFVSSLMFGEPCSTVPLYKKAKV